MMAGLYAPMVQGRGRGKNAEVAVPEAAVVKAAEVAGSEVIVVKYLIEK